MTRFFNICGRTGRLLADQADWVLPTAARLVFAGVLLGYFWASAATKLEGVLTPSVGGYAQIFPKAFETVGYDVAQLGPLHLLVVLVGAWAEYALPLLIVLGVLTRLAALGMIGFVLVQSLTDIVGHGAGTGAWFDRASDALVLDQRAFWMLLFLVLILKGAGPLSADRLLGKALNRLAA